jgi:hypothetical protein
MPESTRAQQAHNRSKPRRDRRALSSYGRRAPERTTRKGKKTNHRFIWGRTTRVTSLPSPSISSSRGLITYHTRNPFNTAEVVAVPDSTRTVDPREEGRGHRETLYFPDHVRARAAAYHPGGLHATTKVVAVAGNWTP